MNPIWSISRLETICKGISFHIPTSSTGNKVVVLKGLGYTPPGAAQPLIRDFSFEFSPGMKLGIAGWAKGGKRAVSARKSPEQ
jgi:ABC-type protease/lipase transport system fused ATPase/permease subunit